MLDGGDFSFLEGNIQDDGMNLGYAANLDKASSQEIYKNSEFIQDVIDYYSERDGIQFQSVEEAYDKFWSDRTWRNMNTISIGRDYLDGKTNSAKQNVRLARLQRVHEALPNFYEEGGRGAVGLGQNAFAALADPINLIGFGSGGAAAKAAAFAAIRSGATKQAAKTAGLKAGATKGFFAEGAANALVEGVADVGIQNRDMEIGLQDKYSLGRTLGSAGVGFALGGAIGVPMGLAGAVMPSFKKKQYGLGSPKHYSKISQGILEGKKTPFEDRVDLTTNEIANDIDDGADAGTIARQTRDNVIARAKQDYDRTVAERANEDGIDLEGGEGNTSPLDEGLSKWSNLQTASSRIDYLTNASNERYKKADEIAATDPEKATELRIEGQRLAEAADRLQAKFNDIDEKYLNGEVPTEEDLNLIQIEDQNASRLLLEFDPNAREATTLPDGSPIEGGSVAETEVPTAPTRGAEEPDGQFRNTAENNQRLSEENAAKVEADEAAIAQEARLAAIKEGQSELTNAQDVVDNSKNKVTGIKRKLNNLNKQFNRAVKTGNADKISQVEQTIEATEAELDAATDELTQAEGNFATARQRVELQKAEAAKTETNQDVSPEAVEEVEATPTGNKVIEEPQSAEEIVDELVNSTDPEEKISFTSLKSTLSYIVDDLGFSRAEVINSLPKAKRGRPTNADKEVFRSVAIQFTERAMVQQQAQSAIEELTSPDQFFDFKIINVILNETFTDARLRNMAQEEYLSAIADQTPTYVANILSENPKLKLSEILMQAEDYYGKEVADIMASAMRSDVVQMNTINMDKLIGKKAAIGNMNKAVTDMTKTIDQVRELRTAILGRMSDEEFERGYANVSSELRIKGQEDLPQAEVRKLVNDPNFKGDVETYSIFYFEKGSGQTPKQAVANDARIKVAEIAKANGINPELNTGEIIEQLELRVKKLQDDIEVGVRTPQNMTQPQGSTMTKAEFAQLSEKEQLYEVFVSKLPKGKVEQINAMREQLIKANIADGTLTPEMAVRTADLAVEKMIDNMMRREEMLGQVDVKGKTFSSNQATREMQDVSVSDEYADNAVHMGKTYEPGFGKITVGRGTTIQGNTASKRTQKVLRAANRLGLNDGAVFRRHGIVDGRRGVVSFQESALQELEQSFIDNATNRVVRSEEKIKDNQVEFDNADNAIKEADKLNAQITKINNQIDENPGGENVPQLEESVALLNGQVAKFYEDAIANAPDYAVARAKQAQETSGEGVTLRGTVLGIRKEFSQETAKEAAARKVEKRKSSPVGKVQAILNEIKNHQDTIGKAKKRGRSKPIMDLLYAEKKELFKRYNAEFKKLPKEDQKKIKEANKKVATQTAAEIEIKQRAREKAVEDIKVEDVPDWFGLGEITPEERASIFEDSQRLADESNKSQAANVEIKAKAQTVLSNDMDTTELVSLVRELKAELDALKNGVPPKAPPSGTTIAPYIRKIDGYEVDVHNHFKWEGTKATGEGFLVFDGVRVASIGKIGDKISFTLLVDKASANDIRIFNSPRMMKDNIPEIFKKRIAEYADRTGAIKKTDGEDGLQYKKEWNKSETYKGRAEADPEENVIQDPVLEPAPISDPANVLTHTAADYTVPPGRKMSIQIVDETEGSTIHGVVRIPNPNQTIGQVLKAASNKKFIIGHNDISVKISSGRRKKGGSTITPASLIEAMNDFVPINEADGKVAYNEPGKLSLGNKTVAPTSPRKRAKRPTKSDDLSEIKVNKRFLPEAVASQIDNAAQLKVYIDRLENISWSQLNTLDDMKRFTKALKQAHTAMAQAVPNGIKRPVLDQRQSFKTLRNVFKGRADDEIEASLDFLRRINPDGSNGAMPRFEGVSGIEGAPKGTVGALSLESNKILLTDKLFEKGGKDNLRQIPATITVVHEVGHWAYHNMLTSSEKMMFWHSMSKYYDADGTLDLELLKKRLPGFAEGEIESPAELFAHQFTSYALNVNAVPDAGLFIRVARHAVTLIERFIFGKHPEGIQEADPDLEALFERIIPKEQLDADGSVVLNASRFAGLEENGYTISPSAGFIGRQLKELDDMRAKLTSVMNVAVVNDAADANMVLKALDETGRAIYGKFGGGQGKTHHYQNKATGEGGGQRVGLLDGQVKNKQEITMPDGTVKLVNIYNYPSARRARNRLLNAQSAIRDYIQEALNHSEKNTANSDAELRQLIAAQQMDMEDTIPDSAFIEMDEMELQNIGSSWEAQAEMLSRETNLSMNQVNYMHIRRLAMDMLNAIDDGQRELVRAFNRNMPRDDASRRVTIDFKGNAYIAQPSLKGRKKKMGDAIQIRQEKQLADDIKELETESVLLTQVGNDALLRSIREGDPQIFMDSLAETNPQIKKSPKSMTDAELNAEKKRTTAGDKRKVDLALEAAARQNTKKIDQSQAEVVSEPDVQKAIDTEIKQTSGTDSIAGIPARTPQPVKDFLRGLSNSNKTQEATGQSIVYRLLNVGGQTSYLPDAIGRDVGFVERSALENYVNGVTTPTASTGGDVAPLSGEFYNKFRKDLRKVTKLLSGNKKLTPDDMGLLSDMAFHLSMPYAQKKHLAQSMFHLNVPIHTDTLLWLKQAITYKAEGNLAELQRHVGVFEYEDGFHKVPANPKAQQLMRVVNRHFETISYAINGHADPDLLPIQYNSYGDMFSAKRNNETITSAVDGADPRFVNKHIVQDYAAETVNNIHEEKGMIARSFLGVDDQADLKRYTYIHSGQDGMNTQVHKTELGEYGPGYYIQTMSEFNSKSSADFHNQGTDDLIKGSNVSENLKTKSLMANRKLTDVNIAIEQLAMERKLADGARKVEISGQLQKLVQRANSLQKIINRTATVNVNSDVVPVFSNPSNLFNFSHTTRYDFVNPSNDNIGWIIADMGEKGLFTANGVNQLKDTLDGTFTGADFYRALTDDNVGIMHKHGNAANSTDAKARLAEYLEDAGYEGAVFSNKGREQVIVNYKSESIKPVNGEYTEAELQNANQMERPGADLKSNGDLMLQMIETGKAFDPADFVGYSAEMQRLSVPDPVVRVVRRMAKKQDLEQGDMQRASVFSTVKNAFTENSIRFRNKGANWYGNILKPKGGIGIFEKHSVDLAAKINPIFTKLEQLPDAKGKLAKWMGRNSGLIGKKPPTPESHKRIVNALRANNLAVLKPQERRIAQQIANAFTKELNDMRNMGIVVGDVTQGGRNGYYFPQVWDVEALRENPNGFVNGLVSMFIREQNSPDWEGGVKLNREQLFEKARELHLRMIDRDGVADESLVQNAITDPFSKRMLTLKPEEIAGMGDYLVNDLQGIMAKYFDRTTRKMALTEKFGVEGHGFDAYYSIAEMGTEAAISILGNSKHLVSKGDGMGAKVDVKQILVPQLNMTRDEIGKLVSEVQKTLGNNPQQNIVKAKNILINAMEYTQRNDPQFLARVDAVVNGLADFRGGIQRKTLLNDLTSMNRVLNKRPIVGEGNEFGHQFTRRLKTFNSVSLLGFTTLTSAPDLVLPLIRSGNMAAFTKAWAKYNTNPAYRAAAKNIGVGIENLMHERFVQMAGEGTQKFANSFFNATLLTDWTNFNRQMASMVGMEAFRSEIANCHALRQRGAQNSSSYRNSERFLARYGLTGSDANIDYLAPGAPRVDMATENLAAIADFKYAAMRFTNEAVFTPNPNDIPMWAQTPWASLMTQLKTFPLMMGRLGKDVLEEAFVHKNPKPLMYMLTAGVGVGALSAGVKDIVQSRGEDAEGNKVRRFRDRSFSKNMSYFADLMGVEEDSNTDKLLGWYLEGLLAMGGLGLFVEMFYNTSAQLDNGKYGFVRTMSGVFGPSVSAAEDAYDVGAGIKDYITEDGSKTGARREMFRSIASRLPVLGGIQSLREGAADLGGKPGGDKMMKSKFGKDKFTSSKGWGNSTW